MERIKMKLITALNKETNQLEEIADPGIRICDGNDLVIPICGNSEKCRYEYTSRDYICLSLKWYLCDDLIRYKT